MRAGLFPEAGGVAGILQRQLILFVPPLAVHRTNGLLRGGYQVFIISLPCATAKDTWRRAEEEIV